MIDREGEHPNEDQLLGSIIDDVDLPSEVQRHLSTCTECRAQRKHLEEGLSRMGSMASRFAPSPRRRIEIPVEEAPTYWNWRRFIAAGTAVTALIAVLVGGALFQSKQDKLLTALQQEMIEDDQFIAEISRLEDNALPLSYLGISDSSNLFPDESSSDKEGSSAEDTYEFDFTA
jgi:hypothetical protein